MRRVANVQRIPRNNLVPFRDDDDDDDDDDDLVASDDDEVTSDDDEVTSDDDGDEVVNHIHIAMEGIRHATSVARITAAVHVGTPSLDFQQWKTNEVYFHGFDSTSGRMKSPSFWLLGHEWQLILFPHGRESVGGDIVSVYLKHLSSDKSIDVEFGFAVKDFNHYNIAGGIATTLTDTFSGQSVNGYPQFIPRQQVLSHLVHGTLVVEVRMRTCKRPPAPFFVANPSACKTIRDLFMDKESADVVFEVGGGKQATDEAGNKSIKTSPKTFYAHRAIVKKAAPQLAELCGAGKSGSSSLIRIPGVTSDIFHHVLSYIYGFGIPHIGIELLQMKEIIEAADKFGVTNLKLEAEARFVTSSTIALDNVMEHLVFAESKNCALVKEAVMDFIVENKAEILEKKTLMDAPAGHMNDILAAIMRGENEGGGKKTKSGFGSMRISELRGRAHASGLDIDGTREMLISALEVSSSIPELEVGSNIEIDSTNNGNGSDDSSDSD